jgi:hypothetical protein
MEYYMNRCWLNLVCLLHSSNIIMSNCERTLFSHTSDRFLPTGKLTFYMFYVKKHISLLHFCDKTFTFATESEKKQKNHLTRLAYIIASSQNNNKTTTNNIKV